jgi:eukaryotic-like serine/threonine-protein kinase
MQLLLEIASGPSAGRKVLLRSDQTVRVGRTDEAEFCVSQDAYLSSVHFSLRCDADACRLEDLESTHGTFVNGERILAAALNDGDTISAGKTAFKVRIVRGATAPSPSAGDAGKSLPAAEEGDAARIVRTTQRGWSHCHR